MELTTLIGKRGVIKGKITKFSNFVDALKDEYEEQLIPRSKVIEIELRLERITPLLEEFQDIQHQIDQIADEVDVNETNAYENSYYAAVSQAKDLIESSEATNKSKAGSASSYEANSIDSGAHNNSLLDRIDIKLPKMPLPTFAGKYTDWLTFRDAYETMIHNAPTLRPMQKFYYLRAALEGDARKIISSITMTSENYEQAWTAVCCRYENKRILIHHHLRALFEMTNISGLSAPQFRSCLDAINNNLHSLAVMGQRTKEWDSIIIYIVGSKLDEATAQEWESRIDSSELPTLDNLKEFLVKKAETLEALNFTKLNIKSKQRTTREHVKTLIAANIQCHFCKGSHVIYKCKDFLAQTPEARQREARTRHLCFNCLRPGHQPKDCRSDGCRICKGKHNSLLHQRERRSSISADQEQTPGQSDTLATSIAMITNAPNAVLSTAEIFIGNEKEVSARAILDTGSQSNFITRHIAKSISAHITPVSANISGIGNNTANISGYCDIIIKSKVNNFQAPIRCLVISQIANYTPADTLSELRLPDVKLADNKFSKAGQIDVLIGNGIFWHLISDGTVMIKNSEIILQNTVLGWVIAGSLLHPITSGEPSCGLSVDIDLHKQVMKFWEIEEFPDNKYFSEDDKQCEKYFLDTYKRDESGRFEVSIPLKLPTTLLGDSRERALKRFYNLERKLQTDSSLRDEYKKFMKEYEELGHMAKIIETPEDRETYYIPHHPVINAASTTTKLRVVFDASAPTTSGYSYNNLQHAGPTIQDDIMSILLRFRQHYFVISADITKMYRQVRVKSNQCRFQRIFWRNDPSNTIEVYELSTVTYGTKAGPFLAIRALQQVAHDNAETYPAAASIILRDFYVDDLLTGTDHDNEALTLCQQIDSILREGGFILRKWLSNEPRVLEKVADYKESSCMRDISNDGIAKTLGLFWSPLNDLLLYSVSDPLPTAVTKRTILSITSKIFDPLGLLSASTILLKIILQMLWKENIDWDEQIPDHIGSLWMSMRDSLPCLNNIHIPRLIKINGVHEIQIHGFSDASEKAYGACIYVLSKDEHGNVLTRLLCAKSKVAPLKVITIPRLELCGALLLSKLLHKVQQSLTIKINKVYCWSDSTTVLTWIRTQPSSLKIFVANRVARIQELTNQAIWRYVPTHDNPADLASRGVLPSVLAEAQNWWDGPTWLSESSSCWPVWEREHADGLEEMRPPPITLVSISTERSFPIARFSNINRLIRVVARISRLACNARLGKNKETGPITVLECDRALFQIVRVVQFQHYKQDIDNLLKYGHVRTPSVLAPLAPFLDADGVIRVGGRLNFSQLSYNERHPIILPPKTHLTNLLMRDAHKRLMHGGANQMISFIRQKFWPIRVRVTAKQIMRECVTCFRAKPRNLPPQMGQIPKERITPSPPFTITGVDYAGPLMIKDRKGRGCKTVKCYLALFVCFSTKAVHIEVVVDLTASAFIAALKRFISRRGYPQEMHSDNATNFVGSDKELGKLLSELNTDKIIDTLAVMGIQWHYIPPRAPHFGGLWESAIRCAKTHLKRMLKAELLTFEQLSTVCCQIEAILNCRPLTPLSDDPQDLETLTPGHFLIGRRLTAIPEPDLQKINPGKLSEYQRLQRIIQGFWTRWSHDYLQTLQPRSKWRRAAARQLRVGDLVVIAEENQPPLSWPLGRISEVFPGKDGAVRAASVRTVKGNFKRPAIKLFVLPVRDEADDNTEGSF